MKSKIFIIYHKPSLEISSSVYSPIAVGKQKKDFPSTFLFDDVGENISSLNEQYNELTAIYWVYKHLDEFKDVEYIGFSHYRRLFCFSHLDRTCFIKGILKEDFISVKEEQISQYFKDFDLVSIYPSYCRSVYKHYAKSHNKEDLDVLLNIIKTDFPIFYDSAKEYLDGYKNYLYNMFIFKKEDFISYCDFIFPLLKKFNEITNNNDRLYISERVTGIFINYLLKQNKKILHLPVYFIREKKFILSLRQTKYNFKYHKEYGFIYKTKPLWLYLLPRWLEKDLRRRNYGKAL